MLEELKEIYALLPEEVNTFEFRIFPTELHLLTAIKKLNNNYSIHQRLHAFHMYLILRVKWPEKNPASPVKHYPMLSLLGSFT